MAGQGKTTKLYSSRLTDEGWKVLFVCIPNTPHVRVVPIPTSHGVSKQRYPDIAAQMGDRLLFVEVEMNLTEAVTQDIVLRFTEMRESLSLPDIYQAWSKKVELVTQYKMPRSPIIETRLKLVNGFDERSACYLCLLEAQGISIVE